MERRGSNTWLVAALAIAVGFLAALLILGNKDDNNNASATVATTATTTSSTATGDSGTTTTSQTTTSGSNVTPQSPEATVPSCISLWNQANNRGAQTFLINIASQQPVRVHVGATSDVPPECLVTIIANNGDAYTFPEGGGTTFPYAIAPGKTTGASLPAAQRTANALEERDGTLKAS